MPRILVRRWALPLMASVFIPTTMPLEVALSLVIFKTYFPNLFPHVSTRFCRWSRSHRLWRFANIDKLDVGNGSVYWRSLQIGPHVKLCSPVTSSSSSFPYGFFFRSLSPYLFRFTNNQSHNPVCSLLRASTRITVMISALSYIYKSGKTSLGWNGRAEIHSSFY